MTDNQSFEQMADQAASGLSRDKELFLDVKQELLSHLEEKTERFTREGHTPEESFELAKKSFGSPIDMASELLDANKRRMRLRSLMRMTFSALIVPIAIILALYVGYGRLTSLQKMVWIMQPSNSFKFQLPAPPGFGKKELLRHDDLSVLMQSRKSENEEAINRILDAHRNDPDFHKYYAYYTLFLPQDNEKKYVAAMREGERIEPQNALYNLFLAEFYLKHGMVAQSERHKKEPKTDEVLDSRMFEAGLAELHKAVKKPYLYTYQSEMMAKKLHARGTPILTDDYIGLIATQAAEMFTHLARSRMLARKIPGAARILIAEGRTSEAESVMDTWKPLMELRLGDSSNFALISPLVNLAFGQILTKEAQPIYAQLGEYEKEQEAVVVNERLAKIGKERRGSIEDRAALGIHLKNYAGVIASTLGVLSPDSSPSVEDLMPSRMHEYVMVEQILLQAILILLMLALLGALIQGKMWLFRLRRAGAVPLLLMPPAKVMLRALLLGILLPIFIYWIYTRMPFIGGREVSLSGGMWPRVTVELFILGLLVLWLPARMIRGYVRKRCAELDVALPEKRKEAAIGWKLRIYVFIALVLGSAGFILAPLTDILELKLLGSFIGIITLIAAPWFAWKSRKDFGLYYGTLARSVAPLYAFAILFISLVIQPWLLYNEVKWLRKDTLFWGYHAHTDHQSMSLSALGEQAASQLSELIRKAMPKK